MNVSSYAWFPVTVVLATLILGGCSSRSVEAFCSEMDSGYEEIQAHVDSAGEDAFGGLVSVAANAGVYTRMLHRMQEVAPEEISGDFDDSVDAWDSQADAMGDVASNPLGTLAQQFLTSMMASASMQRVDAYTKEHCGRTLFSFSLERTESNASGTDTTPSPTVPALPAGALAAPDISMGSQLAVAEAGGLFAILASSEVEPGTGTTIRGGTEDGNGSGETISVFTLDGRSKTMAYVPGNQSCSAIFGPGPGGSALVLVHESEERPASGLTDTSWGEIVSAYDARTGQEKWRTEVTDSDWAAALNTGSCKVPGNGHVGFSMTSDGGFAAIGTARIDLSSGTVTEVDVIEGAIGRWLLARDPDGGGYTHFILDPGTLKRLGKLDGDVLDWDDRPAHATGLAPTWVEGQQELVAVYSGALVAATLPSGDAAWTVSVESTLRVVGYANEAEMLLTASEGVSAGGTIAWQQPNFHGCAATDSDAIGVGGTLVRLDARTGKETGAVSSVSQCLQPLPASFSAGILRAEEGYVMIDEGGIWEALSRTG